jgi:hypothetical protein
MVTGIMCPRGPRTANSHWRCRGRKKSLVIFIFFKKHLLPPQGKEWVRVGTKETPQDLMAAPVAGCFLRTGSQSAKAQFRSYG